MMQSRPIVLFSDFGASGIYIGQVKLAIQQRAPHLTVLDLVNDAPCFRPKAAAYLLAALMRKMTTPVVCFAVVDPGVGSERRGLIIETSRHIFVGPDNGLFELIYRSDPGARIAEIIWQPDGMSASFHGRDLFAPVAADLASGAAWPEHRTLAHSTVERRPWPQDLYEIIYIDHYGNAFTGIRASAAPDVLVVAGQRLVRRRTFSDAALGSAFWYENALGLAEIAVREGHAAEKLGLALADSVYPG